MGALFEKPAFLVLLLLVLLLFGAKRLPELARGVGRSMRILKAEADAVTTNAEQENQVEASPSRDFVERQLSHPIPPPVGHMPVRPGSIETSAKDQVSEPDEHLSGS